MLLSGVCVWVNRNRKDCLTFTPSGWEWWYMSILRNNETTLVTISSSFFCSLKLTRFIFFCVGGGTTRMFWWKVVMCGDEWMSDQGVDAMHTRDGEMWDEYEKISAFFYFILLVMKWNLQILWFCLPCYFLMVTLGGWWEEEEGGGEVLSLSLVPCSSVFFTSGRPRTTLSWDTCPLSGRVAVPTEYFLLSWAIK